MGIKDDIISKVQAPNTHVSVAIDRKRRIQLEYALQTQLPILHTKRNRNGTVFDMGNGSKITIYVGGGREVDVNLVEMKAKEWREWITDKEPEEDASQSTE